MRSVLIKNRSCWGIDNSRATITIGGFPFTFAAFDWWQIIEQQQQQQHTGFISPVATRGKPTREREREREREGRRRVVVGFIENSPFDTSWHESWIDRPTIISLLQEPIEQHWYAFMATNGNRNPKTASQKSQKASDSIQLSLVSYNKLE